MKRILSIFIFFFLVSPLGHNNFVFAQDEVVVQNQSLDTVLNELGFKEVQQKEAFKKLCVSAGIELPDSFDSKALLKFVLDAQISFTNRKDKQERWEISPLEWTSKDTEQHLACIKDLNFVLDDVFPKFKEYSAVCVLGAVNSTMKYRIKFLEQLVNSGVDIDKIFLLSGERYVSLVDGSEEDLLEICKKVGVERKDLTEAHLIENIFKSSSLSKYFTYVLINTPGVDGRRPTTKTTVQKFCQWREENNFNGKVLFISNQPHVFYQEAVIGEILDGKNIDFEVVGPKTSSQNIQTLVGALGSYLWAAVPKIFVKFGFSVSPEEKEMVKSLYGESSYLLK